MFKNFKRLVSLSIVTSILVSQVFLNSPAYAANTTINKSRLYGTGRIQTAIEISKAGWKLSSDYAIIATANDYPDALCAAPLAKLYNAPLLLTDNNTLNYDVKSELQRLKVKNIIIVGGTAAISDTVASELRGIANVERISGANREETSVEIAKRLGSVSVAVLATGLDFPDALSISSIAAFKKMPILLTGQNSLDAKVNKYIKDSGIWTTYIIGGQGVIGTAVEAAVPGPIRISGSDRIQTNYEVISKFSSELNFDKIYVATALNFPDALAGSALAAATSSPIILADSSISYSTRNLIKEKAKSSIEILTLGGQGVVSDSIVNSIEGSINENTTGSLNVESVTAINLNQIKVTYNKEVDKRSSENPNNYLLDGATLISGDSLILQPDRRTVMITLRNSVPQQTKASFVVKNNLVLTEDTSSSFPKYETDLKFIDVTAPTVKSIYSTSNDTIVVEFSEAIKMPTELINSVGTTFKMDDQYLVNYGFSGANALNFTVPNFYSDKLEIGFSSGVSTGAHILTIPDGTDLQLVDGAGYKFAKYSKSFEVSASYDIPRVVNVTAETNGAAYVTFDRSMDPITAQGDYLYKIENNPAVAADFKSGSENKVVKLVFAPSVVKKGGNILVIDKNVKDVNGNKLSSDSDIRYPFNAVDDTVKPTVVSAALVDNKTIRVKFSEAMDTQYATKKENYSLMDSTGLTLDYISYITYLDANAYSDTISIVLNTALTGSNYTLKIKTLKDLAAVPNTLDDYTTSIGGFDDVPPELIEEIIVDGSTSDLVVYFNEEMNKSTLTDKTNYTYKDADDKYHELPSGATLTAGLDNRSVRISFPGGYYVKLFGWIGEYNVKGVRVSNVKDTAGNALKDFVAYKDVISTVSAISKPTYVVNSFKLFSDSSKVWAEFELSQALSLFYMTDFRVSNMTPDSGLLSGRKITLNYTDANKKAIIKYAGANATLYTASNASTNDSGVHIAYFSGITVYDDKIKPELLSVVASDGTSSGDDSITFKFSEKIDNEISGTYTDDFEFLGGGTSITPKYVLTSNEYVTYFFKPSAFSRGDSVIVKPVMGNLSICDVKDTASNQNIYEPTSSDRTGIIVTVN